MRELAGEVRQLMWMQLDELARRARAVADTTHYLVDKGRVVMWDGVPIQDDGPILAAIDRLVKIQESQRKLDGLDIPVKQLVGGDITVTYQFEGVDVAALR
ncbi:hypothetical protein [Nonomuraea roseola]|uniref:Uncharacterized protein n=1 Tax=Nonomuraea roseola TaxID=46179 RepID=A0ABV5Q6L3_9ACTN